MNTEYTHFYSEDSIKGFCKNPAFPNPAPDNDSYHEGLSRHEYLTAIIFNGMLANPAITHPLQGDDAKLEDLIDEAVRLAKLLVDRTY